MSAERILITAGLTCVAIAGVVVWLRLMYLAAGKLIDAYVRWHRAASPPLLGGQARTWKPSDGYPLPPIPDCDACPHDASQHAGLGCTVLFCGCETPRWQLGRELRHRVCGACSRDLPEDGGRLVSRYRDYSAGGMPWVEVRACPSCGEHTRFTPLMGAEL